MNKEDSRTELGMVRIHDNVIASIASVAATEIEGVKSIGKNFKASFFELIDKNRSSAITITKDKNGDISVNVPIVIKYGFNIPDIASKVQENIRAGLERMTNLPIKDINIIVQSIERS